MYMRRRQHYTCSPWSKRKSIAIWGCLIFNHGFVLLRMMEEQIFGRRRKEKEMKERKMKGKGKEKERKLEKGLSVVSLFFFWTNGYFKGVARGGANFASSDPSFSLAHWFIIIIEAGSQVPYYKTTQIHIASGKRLRNITMENHHVQCINPL